MKKIYILLIFLTLLITCIGCKENNDLDLEELYEKNAELAFNHFLGWGRNELKYELIIFEVEKANSFEIAHFSSYFIDGAEKILYVKYEDVHLIPFIVAVQYESVELARSLWAPQQSQLIRNENIVARQVSGAYLLLYGEYKEIDGYCLSIDDEALLFDNQGAERKDIVIPNGVKIVPAFSLVSYNVKTVKCNSELEILYNTAFAFLYSLEKIELNDGLKEIYTNCFMYHNLEYLVIPESVEKIQAEAFQDVTIYCNVEKIPYGWHKDFALNNCKVYWKGTWEYVDGVPKPILNEG